MWPLWTLLCQPTRFAGGGKRASRAGAREVLRVYRLSLFLRKRVMFTCSLTKSKSQLSLFTELSALTSSRHSSLHIAAFSSISKLRPQDERSNRV